MWLDCSLLVAENGHSSRQTQHLTGTAPCPLSLCVPVSPCPLSLHAPHFCVPSSPFSPSLHVPQMAHLVSRPQTDRSGTDRGIGKDIASWWTRELTAAERGRIRQAGLATAGKTGLNVMQRSGQSGRAGNVKAYLVQALGCRVINQAESQG